MLLSMGIENSMTVMVLINYIRMRILKIDNKISLFVKVKNTIKNMGDTIGSLYEKYVEEDGFLYIEFKKEHTF